MGWKRVDTTTTTRRKRLQTTTTARRIAGIAGAVAAFTVLSWAASSTTMHRWDQAVTAWLQRSAPNFDLSAGVVVFLGNAEVLIPCIALAAIILFARRPGVRMSGLCPAAGLSVAGLVAVGLTSQIDISWSTANSQGPALYMF